MKAKNHNKGVLIISPTFNPDIGGVETHLTDLVNKLSNEDFNAYVCTHKPIVTKGVTNYKRKEILNNKVMILRFWWIGSGLFHKFENYPLIQFIYLCPYLFLRTFIFMIFNSRNIDIVHSQGFSGAAVGILIKKIFKKRLIISTHAIYEIDKDSSTAKRIAYILSKADKVLCLSNGSYNELILFGIKKEKVDIFKYWINLDIFKPLDKTQLRKTLGIEAKFTVLFVGRLIEKKGIRVLCEVASNMLQINFVFIGTGPEEGFLKTQAKEHQNIKFVGTIKNTELYQYYNIADIFCIPSQYEEGFGRVVMEAVACGLPVVGSNKGGIPEALDSSISILVEPTVENLGNAIKKVYFDKNKYLELSSNCRKYAKENYSENNINLITKYY